MTNFVDKTCHVCGVNLTSLPPFKRVLRFVDVGSVPNVGLCEVCHDYTEEIAAAWKTADENIDDVELLTKLRAHWDAYAEVAQIDVTFGHEA